MGFEQIIIDGSQGPPDAPRWKPDQYEAAVSYLIDALLRPFAVSAYLGNHLRQKAFIRPMQSTVGSNAAAYTVATDGRAALPLGERQRFARDQPSTRWDDTGLLEAGTMAGTGLGTSSAIYFTPADFVRPNAPIPRGSYAPIYPDTVLVHELVHAVRNSWGVAISRRFDSDRHNTWAMETNEEYYGTVIMNMYSSQRRLPLWTAYHDQTVMQMRTNRRGLQDPYAALQHRWIGQFFHEIPTLANDLARLSPAACEYNPFRQFAARDYRRIAAVPMTRRLVPDLVGPPTRPQLIPIRF